jgi:hypothetical protein
MWMFRASFISRHNRRGISVELQATSAAQIDDIMDTRLLNSSAKAIGRKGMDLGKIKNTDRAVGAMLVREIVKENGTSILPKIPSMQDFMVRPDKASVHFLPRGLLYP